MTRVLDAHAMLAFLEREPGYNIVETCFIEAVESGENLLMSTVNYGEIRYIILRECGHDKALEIDRFMNTLPITFIDADLALTREAAGLRAFHRLSYADCFAAALAKQHDAEIVTGDPEFETVEEVVKVLWVR